jgi:hypothetical protein
MCADFHETQDFSTALHAGLLYLILPDSNDEDRKHISKFINNFKYVMTFDEADL